MRPAHWIYVCNARVLVCQPHVFCLFQFVCPVSFLLWGSISLFCVFVCQLIDWLLGAGCTVLPNSLFVVLCLFAIRPFVILMFVGYCLVVGWLSYVRLRAHARMLNTRVHAFLCVHVHQFHDFSVTHSMVFLLHGFTCYIFQWSAKDHCKVHVNATTMFVPIRIHVRGKTRVHVFLCFDLDSHSCLLLYRKQNHVWWLYVFCSRRQHMTFFARTIRKYSNMPCYTLPNIRRPCVAVERVG